MGDPRSAAASIGSAVGNRTTAPTSAAGSRSRAAARSLSARWPAPRCDSAASIAPAPIVGPPVHRPSGSRPPGRAPQPPAQPATASRCRVPARAQRSGRGRGRAARVGHRDDAGLPQVPAQRHGRPGQRGDSGAFAWHSPPPSAKLPRQQRDEHRHQRPRDEADEPDRFVDRSQHQRQRGAEERKPGRPREWRRERCREQRVPQRTQRVGGVRIGVLAVQPRESVPGDQRDCRPQDDQGQQGERPRCLRLVSPDRRRGA